MRRTNKTNKTSRTYRTYRTYWTYKTYNTELLNFPSAGRRCNRGRDGHATSVPMYNRAMVMEFSGEVWFWKGPAPWYFVTVPDLQAREIKDISAAVTYGWGMIPVVVQIGKTEYKTALWPKDGSYIVPIKSTVRKAERIGEGEVVAIRLQVIADAWCG